MRKKPGVEVGELIKDAAKRLTGFRRRAYQAEITSEYSDGSARRADDGEEPVSEMLSELI